MSLSFDPHSPVGRRIIRFAAWLIRVLLTTLGRTYRVRVIEGQEHVDRILAEAKPVLLSFWHNRVFLGAGYLYHSWIRRGFDITVLTSQSRDGELVAELARQWGLSVVRGSSSRGGRAALRALHRAVVKNGSSPILIPDGPRGPIYEFKVGAAVLSQTSGASILPIGFAAQRFFRIKSWDRIIVPWPFSKVTVCVGEPRQIPNKLSSDELELERRRLESTLDELTIRAEAELGAVDSARLKAGE